MLQLEIVAWAGLLRRSGHGGVDEAGLWAAEPETVLARVAGRFSRVDLRWRMRDYVRGLLSPVE
ncbi:hypothetical protein ACIRPT_33740 [Streptomyces sp. NPDC101227]|uniref:hypothetical protein n=1 Tax=Streptomyces sp. NPDC101227 TaxID=3366136 RepID=UPI00381B97F9